MYQFFCEAFLIILYCYILFFILFHYRETELF